MATKRQGRMGIFQNGSQAPRKRQTASPSSLSVLSGIAYAWDLTTDALTWGPNAAESLGFSARDLPKTGQAFAQFIEPGSGTSRYDAIADEASPSGSYETRHAVRLGPDQVLMVQDSGRWQPDAHGRPAYVRGLLRPDPSPAMQDCQPAIVRTRSELLRRVQESINEALRLSQTCTLIAGSFEGDGEPETMQALARKLRPMMRRHDRLGTLSPTRFVLTLTHCPASDAADAMKRLAGLLKEACPNLHLGAACSPDHTFQPVKLLSFAEMALEGSIERGDLLALYNARPGRRSKAAEQAPFDLVDALNDRRLTLVCRPVADAQSRAPALLQACASLIAPDGSPVPLGPLPGLKEANLALLVDGRMLELAADHLARHPDERMALPLSPATLKDGEWLSLLAAHLGARPGIESRLLIEVPEIALDGDGTILGRLHAMKALGLGLSLSGFGTGRVSLSQLRLLPFDLLKIDGIFIQPLKRSTEDRLFVRTLVDRAQSVGIAIAAEWVDDETTARLLASWGVDYLEGSLFGEWEAVAQPTLGQILKKARA